MLFDRTYEMRYELKDLERRIAAAPSLAEIEEAVGRADRTSIRETLGERLVRTGARIAGLRPDRTWHHLLEHSTCE